MSYNLETIKKLGELIAINPAYDLSGADATAKMQTMLDAFTLLGANLEQIADAPELAADVKSMFNPLQGATPLREDVAIKTHSRDQILAGSPAQNGEYFVLPQIL